MYFNIHRKVIEIKNNHSFYGGIVCCTFYRKNRHHTINLSLGMRQSSTWKKKNKTLQQNLFTRYSPFSSSTSYPSKHYWYLIFPFLTFRPGYDHKSHCIVPLRRGRSLDPRSNNEFIQQTNFSFLLVLSFRKVDFSSNSNAQWFKGDLQKSLELMLFLPVPMDRQKSLRTFSL